MIYATNTLSPAMFPARCSISLMRVDRSAVIDLLYDSHRDLRMPPLTQWGRRIVTDGLGLDSPPMECRRFIVDHGDDVIVVKYTGGKIEWLDEFDPQKFALYHLELSAHV